MRDKTSSLTDAVAAHIRDGDTVFVGGFGQCIPFATAHEIVRQNRTGLTLCRSGADILFDMLIAAGCVKKAVFGYVGNPGIGLGHAFRRAVEAGQIEVEDWTNFAMVLRLHAGALGIPFIPTATLVGGDLPAGVRTAPVKCPFTGEALVAVPALNPDVAIVHGQFADAEGNLQLFGLSGDTVDGALASKRIVATVEKIVPAATIRARPDRTIVPGFRIAAVCEVPYGAHPAYVEGFYGRDDAAYAEWDKLARSAERLGAWLDGEIRGVGSFEEYWARLDPARVAALKAARGREIGGAA
jgi:glutaconate CoA-transferase subunit A